MEKFQKAVLYGSWVRTNFYTFQASTYDGTG